MLSPWRRSTAWSDHPIPSRGSPPRSLISMAKKYSISIGLESGDATRKIRDFRTELERVDKVAITTFGRLDQLLLRSSANTEALRAHVAKLTASMAQLGSQQANAAATASSGFNRMAAANHAATQSVSALPKAHVAGGTAAAPAANPTGPGR